MDPCEGSSHASEDTDGFPSILDTDHPSCQLDVRLTRHKASWINQVCVQEEPPQDLCLQGATVQNSRKLLVVDIPSPSDLSLLCHGDSLALTPMSENTADAICCSSAHGSEGRNDDFSMATDKQEVHPQQESLLRNPKTVATSPFPKEDRARFESLRLTASADDGATRSSSRSHSWNFFPPETFMLPIDVEKENVHFYAADMIISAMENMKCNLQSQQQPDCCWGPEEASRSRGSDQPAADVTISTQAKQGSALSDSDYEGKLGECSNSECCDLHACCLSSAQS